MLPSRQRDHESSGTFQQHGIIAFGELLCRLLDVFEIDGASVNLSCQMGGTRIGEYFGHGESFPVLGQ